MVALSRCLQVSALLAGSTWSAAGARISRKHSVEEQVKPGTKFVAGVPILNYHLAYGGGPSLTELGQGVEEQWVVMMNKKTTEKEMQAFCTGRACTLRGNPEQGGVPFVGLQGTEQDLEEALLASKGLATFVEPDLKAYAIPEIDAKASASSASWGLGHVGASSAATTGKGVHAYITDSGIRTTHTDFGGRAFSSVDMTSGSLVECNGASNCAQDSNGHGTHCAGTVAGSSYGVAPGASVYGVKVLGDDGSGSWSWSFSALDWVATKGSRPAVASMSLGGGGQIPGMDTAVSTAVEAGVTVVVAAGNEDQDACRFSPAYVQAAITVGSIDSEYQRSWFSNYGQCTDIWAPGSDITSASHTSDTGAETFSGTSMACPHVSGGAALLLEANPSMSAQQILSSMLRTAIADVIKDQKYKDTNKLLYVGEDAPPSIPTVAPPRSTCPSGSNGPDSEADCRCQTGYQCWEGDKITCPYSQNGMRSTKWFAVVCPTCFCKQKATPAPPPPSPSPAASCAAIGCGKKYDRRLPCQCNRRCGNYGNCCSDFSELC